MTLPYDTARCPGAGHAICQLCRRREPGHHQWQVTIAPPIDRATGECGMFIEPINQPGTPARSKDDHKQETPRKGGQHARLGPLPKTEYTLASGFAVSRMPGYTADQMRAYAAAAVAAAPAMAAALDCIVRRLQMDVNDGSRPDQWTMEYLIRTAKAALPAGWVIGAA